MKNTEKAFHWIINILEEKEIDYKISGGFAARIYGVDRELADIDIEVSDEDILLIEKEVKEYIIFGPARYLNENWDLELMTLEYEGQEIDIAGSGAKIFNKQTREWENISNGVNDNIVKEVYGIKVRVESINSLISYKTKLAREVDLEDVKQLKNLVNRI